MGKNGRRRAGGIGIACFVAVLLACSQALAEPIAAKGDADKWQFELTPYLFGAGLNGTTGFSRVTADVDMSFGDVLNNLDSGFMGLGEARKGLWSFALEGVYFKLKGEGAKSWDGPLGNTSTGTVEATMTEQLYQVSVANRMVDDNMKVDLVCAARYTGIDSDLDLVATTGADLLPDGSRSISTSVDWWDPVIGVRALQPLGEKFSFVWYADVGGFGVGSDLTFQLLAGLNWQFAKNVSAKVGYRYLYQDYENDGFVWDMASSGFYLGMGFKF